MEHYQHKPNTLPSETTMSATADRTLTSTDLVRTLDDVSFRAGAILGKMNLIRSPRLQALEAGYLAAVRTADPDVIAKMEGLAVDGIFDTMQDLSHDQLTAAEIIGISETAQDASTSPLSGGLCGGGRGASAVNPMKVAAGIRMNAARADGLMRLAATDAQLYNDVAVNMYQVLEGYPTQQAEYLETMISTQKHQDQMLADTVADAVFATSLSSALLGDDDVLSFNVIPSTGGAAVGETLA